MRTFKWDPMFKEEEETTIAVAWISFSSLPPNLFWEGGHFLPGYGCWESIKVDIATKNKIRPSYARVKVEVDLLCDFP